MRKKAIIAIVVAGLLMCGCTFNNQSGPINQGHGSGSDDKPATVDDGEPVSPIQGLPDDINILPGLPGDANLPSEEEQLNTIWACRDMWIFSDYLGEDHNIFYAVSDLDGNGRLELIATDSYNPDNFSTYYIYEVDVSGEGMNEVQNDIMEGESMPDIEWGDVFYFAKDQDGTVLGLVMKDSLKVNDGEGYIVNKDFVSMKDGRISYEYIASANTMYDGNGQVESQIFVDKDGNSMDGWDEFDAYDEKYLKQRFPDAEIKVMAVISMYATNTDPNDVYDLLKESLEKHGEYESFDDFYDNVYYGGAAEDGKGSDWIDQNGELTTKTVSKEDLENCQYCAFETYVYEMNTYHDYQSDDDFQTHTLYFDTEGGGSFYYYGYNGTEDWTITEITFDEEPSFYAYAKMKNGDYEMNSVLQFYTFTFSDGGSTLDVIGLDFGEEYIYFWPFG